MFSYAEYRNIITMVKQNLPIIDFSEVDDKTNSYSKPINISLEIQGSNFKTGKVVITDNCSGIPSLTNVAQTIGDSEKKNNRFANGQFGFGIFSFMAACENLTIKSKYNSNDAYLMKIPKSEFEKADISNIHQIKNLFNEVDVVFHLACSKNTICMENPSRDLQINASGTLNLLQCSRNAVVKPILANTPGR